MPQGKLIVVTGPSGVGKRVLGSHVLAHVPDCWFSVSSTTRARRHGEVDGKDYHFITREEFERRIADDGFFEYAPYAGNLYGTPYKEVMDQLAQGKTVIAELEVQGAKKAKQKLPEAETIFISPPEPVIETLRMRILGRGEPPPNLEERLATALVELKEEEFFDHHIVNDELEVAKNEMLWLVRRILRESRAAA